MVQTEQIRDYVFPLAVVENGKLTRLTGTGFLIGSNGYGLTASHCVRSNGDEQLSALFVVNDEWEAVRVVDASVHPSEDVAVLRLATTGLASIMQLSSDEHFGSLRYRGWGYPDDTFHEMVIDGRADLRPDLVYAEGYVR